MQGLVSPVASAATAPRWTRPRELLVYLVPVGDIPPELFSAYTRLLRAHSELPLRTLTRPGGYAAELSPFRSLEWSGAGALRFRFVSTAERVSSWDGEDVQACRRVLGVLGVCHCPSLRTGLGVAHAQFEASVRRFPGLLVHKCFAFEHTFDDASTRECGALQDLVMFPVHHEIAGTGESTVSVHLRVVMETLAVSILMSLESAIRSATSTAATAASSSSSAAAAAALDASGADLASVLLDTNVEPQQTQELLQMSQEAVNPVPLLSRDGKVNSLPTLSSSGSIRSPFSSASSFSLSSTASPSVAAVGAVSGMTPTADPRGRLHRRKLARREKLVGDYCVLVSCVPDALEHYTVAVELLREEERRSGGAPGDALWLAAALEGLAFCLYEETQVKFSAELVEKASEAVALYAKAGTTELESLLIESLGWYYAGVATVTLADGSLGESRVLEGVWAKRLLWDSLERGLTLFPELQSQRQVEFLVQGSRMLESVGHRRRMAFFLHEATSLLLTRNAPHMDAQMQLLLSPSSASGSPQKQRDLEAALVLERLVAARLGIKVESVGRRKSDLPWEVTSLHRKLKPDSKSQAAERMKSWNPPDDSWLIVRFHVLRQLLTTARMLGDALLVGTYCLQLLEMLVWCDSIALPSLSATRRLASRDTSLLVDHLQQPASMQRADIAAPARTALGLHAKDGVYSSPPPGISTKTRRHFNSPAVAMSSAAASLSSTLTNTPRILATPRQQFSAAVSAFSTKASPAFTPFSHHQNGIADRGAVRGGVGSQSRGGGGDGSEDDFIGNDEGEERLLDTLEEAPVVWDLRSKTELAGIERKLLSILETDCTVLRLGKQVQLSTFLRVDRLKLRSSCDPQHPFLARTTALEMFSPHSSAQQTRKKDFFYSPFEKQQKLQRAGKHRNDDDDEVDEVPEMYERAFPAQEQIELQMVLSNPLGVSITVQQIRAWVTIGDKQGVGDSSTGIDGIDGVDEIDANSAAVECYPCSLSLEPYEKHKTVRLWIRPLQAGTFWIRGCFIKASNVTTSFTLSAPVNLRVVGELPLVSLSLRESDSTTLPDDDHIRTEPQNREQAKVRIAMFSSELKQCMLRIRSTGRQQITHYRLGVTIQQRHAAKQTCVLFNNLPRIPSETGDAGQTTVGPTDDSFGKLETQSLGLRCGSVKYPALPMTSGGFVDLPFEISLRKSSDQGELRDQELQLEWSFVYADDGLAGEKGGVADTDAVFYRESKFVLQLVPLPSLTLRSVDVMSCCPERPPIRPVGSDSSLRGAGIRVQRAMTDHCFCVAVVHVVNPTETGFRFRLRRRQRRGSDLTNEDAVSCEAEVGRQCSRRFMVELPRLARLMEESEENLANVLNSLLEMEWETFFGAQGRLRCEDSHLGSTAEQDHAKLELSLSPISFTVTSPVEVPVLSVEGRGHNGDRNPGQLDSAKKSCSGLDSLEFFQVPHLRAERRVIRTDLFQYVPLVFVIRPQVDIGTNGEQRHFIVEIEVVITQEDEEEDETLGDRVMVVGLLKTQLYWEGSVHESEKRHEIQCLFLSEGVFRVTICGRVLDPETFQAGREIWCHRPMYIYVSPEPAALESTAGSE